MKPPILALIHGWGLGRAAWTPVVDALAARQIDVVCVDLPGYGGTRCLTEDFTATARALADSLPENCVICGWSLGGMLALEAARIAPQQVGGLVLVGCTPSFTQRSDWPCAQPPELLQSFCEAIATDAPATLKRFFGLVNQGDTHARSISRLMAKPILSAQQPDTATLLTGLHWLRDVDLRPHIASIAAPALIIHGDTDPLMPLTAAEWLRKTLPQSRLEVFSGAAHAPFLNDPERFAALLGDYCHALARH
ncbi:alpha/beta fold hydrolase [Propionivibrio limicola]|uniref:alpha/beta fold hydrolase n=1 Tax=Propionivibrio limicola TaxID=167645 RepID=UPI0012925BBA|nr:alpha/beta fold hydrolase [Propionivibrio limicola]